MPDWFFDVSTLLRELRRKAMDAKARALATSIVDSFEFRI